MKQRRQPHSSQEHPTVSDLVRYSLDGLEDNDLARLIATHLSNCQACRTVKLNFIVRALRSGRRSLISRTRGHIKYLDLERYHLGMIHEPELTTIAEHLLVCPLCVTRAEEVEDDVDLVRAAMVTGEKDQES